jgi:hypothetical protein
MEITMLCDRHTSNFAGGQVGFINFMILPYFTLFSKILPKLEYSIAACQNNVTKYKELIDSYEEQKKEGNPKF